LPVEILAAADDVEHVVLAPLPLIFERRHPNVENGEDEVAAIELGFARQEQVKFGLAVLAPQRAGRDDRDEKHGLGDRRSDFVFPESPLRDRGLVLPQSEFRSGAAKLAAQLPTNTIS
jgi:hypothetical protein